MAFNRSVAPLNPPPELLGHVGLGCAPIGDLFTAVSDAEAEATIVEAQESGVAFFDTAPHYGAGVSERRLGDALRGADRESISIATKVGRDIVDDRGRTVPTGAVGSRTVGDLSSDGVLRSLESSLTRLRVDRVDVLYLHDPENIDVALDVTLPAMLSLRDQGLVRAIGVGMNESAPLARMISESEVDVVMQAGRYTLLDRSATDDLLPIALDQGVGVVAAGVFNTGVLAEPVDGAPFNYKPAPLDVIEKARGLQVRCRSYGVELSTVAVQFPLRHPAVDAIVVGARTADEVRVFVADAKTPVPEELWEELSRC